MGTPAGQPKPMDAAEFKSASTPNLVTFRIKDIEPPTSLYIQRDDTLFFSGISSNQATTFTITVRLWLAAEGRITTIQASPKATLGYTPQQQSITLAEGFLLSAVVSTNGIVDPGSTYAQLILNRGPVGFPPVSPGGVLYAGYIGVAFPQGWPGGGVSPPGSGTGTRRVVTVTSPLAGQDWTQAAQAQAYWEVEYFNAVLTTSASAGNRQVQVIIDNGVTTNYVGSPSANIPATTTANVTGAQLNATSTVIATNINVPLPPKSLLSSTDRIRSSTVGILAGDQWSAIQLVVREWVFLS